MRLLTFLLITIATFTSWGQFTENNKNNKVGLSYQNNTILKAKYDSIFIGDSVVVTAYKKKNVYYINQIGEKVYKGKLAGVSRFETGLGIIKDKKGNAGILRRNGTYLMQLTACKNDPLRINKLIHVITASNEHRLYGPNGILQTGFTEGFTFDHWFVASTVTKTPKTTTKKRTFRKDKVTTTYTTKNSMEIYNSKTSEHFASNISKITMYGSSYIFNKNNGGFNMVHSKNGVSHKNLSDFDSINENWFSARESGILHLFESKSLKSIIAGDYKKFEFYEDLIFALGEKSTNGQNMDVFSTTGDLIAKQLYFVQNLYDGRLILGADSLQYIADLTGKQLSKKYFQIGTERNGFRLVYDRYAYGYINDRTYAVIEAKFPIIGRLRSTYPKRKKFAVQRMVESFQDVMRKFAGWEQLDRNGNTVEGAINIEERGSGFSEGLAVVCLYGIQKNRKYEALTMSTNRGDKTYNYIDTSGNFLNKKRYKTAYDFHNNHAWVQDGEYFKLIDKNGKTKGNFKFSSVYRDENGYYIVSKHAQDGLITPDFKQVVSCSHFSIIYEDGKYYSERGTEKTLIHTMEINP